MFNRSQITGHLVEEHGILTPGGHILGIGSGKEFLGTQQILYQPLIDGAALSPAPSSFHDGPGAAHPTAKNTHRIATLDSLHEVAQVSRNRVRSEPSGLPQCLMIEIVPDLVNDSKMRMR
ncbi:MAG: hypothetical protein HY690_16735 [Chloroflexi bacterium]|nr:hypothetical protein [Chloroflexota bacterium]